MAALVGEGQVVHLKGQVSLDGRGEIVGRGDMRAQVRQTLKNIEAVLESLGGTMGDVISLLQHTTNIGEFMKCGDIRSEYFKPPYPVTTTVEVARLYDPEIMIEITAVAEIPRDRLKLPR